MNLKRKTMQVTAAYHRFLRQLRSASEHCQRVDSRLALALCARSFVCRRVRVFFCKCRGSQFLCICILISQLYACLLLFRAIPHNPYSKEKDKHSATVLRTVPRTVPRTQFVLQTQNSCRSVSHRSRRQSHAHWCLRFALAATLTQRD